MFFFLQTLTLKLLCIGFFFWLLFKVHSINEDSDRQISKQEKNLNPVGKLSVIKVVSFDI